jgi:hypothetical protein
LLLALARAVAAAIALALFGLLDQLGEDVDDFVLLLAGFASRVLERQFAAAKIHAEMHVTERAFLK